MTDTKKKKVAILGGGVAALTTAWELTQGDRATRHDVTIYQMGWRLGGKGASSRASAPDQGLRIEEHGLHVWLGFYDNAFKMIQDVYAARAPHLAPDEQLRTWRDAFMPQAFTPIGNDEGGKFTWWSFTWPPMAGTPGQGGVFPTPWQMLENIVLVIKWLLGQIAGDVAVDVEHEVLEVPGWVEDLYKEAVPSHLFASAASHAHGLIDRVTHWVRSFGGDHRAQPKEHHAGISEMLDVVSRHVQSGNSPSTEARDLYAAFVIAVALTKGMLSPRWGVLWHQDLDRVDQYELREWLILNGADPTIVEKSSLLRALYDLAFGYVDGDADKPNFAAGTATRCILRIVFTYKEAALFLMTSGMGEVVVAPMYEELVRRGVKFEWFHKVEALRLSAGKTAIERVECAAQARPRGGEAYRPTFRHAGITCWPDQPFWDQLEDGERLRQHFAGTASSFESHWAQPEPVARRTLVRGVDFDEVVLGISMGAFQKLNDEDPWMVEELAEANPRFASMLTLPLNPTMGVQLWMTPDLAGLGWREPKPAMDAAPELFSVWADMSQELPREAWGPNGPGSVHYLCGVYPTDLYKAPASQGDVPRRARAAVLELTRQWFAQWGGAMWPEVRDPKNPAGVNWAAAHAPANLSGDQRLDFQWMRPNVDPTECAVAAATGTSRFRLDPGASGFDNLYLAGDWTSNGLNTLCVEAAVMSGMRAAACLSGDAIDIVGWDFLRKGGFHAPDPGVTMTATPEPPATPPSAPAPVVAAAAGTLPMYVSQRGHGEQSSLPPGKVEGGMGWWFAVRGDTQAMQNLVDAQLNRPTGGNGPDYRVLGSHMLISILDADRLTTPSELVGYVPDQECGLWIPLVVWGKHLPKRIVFWMPYIFINSSAGMCTGREVWGYPKEISSFVVPRDPRTADAFIVNATIFRNFGKQTLGTFEPLIRIQRPDGDAGAPAAEDKGWSGFGHMAREIGEALVGAAKGFSIAGVAEAAELAEIALTLDVPLVNLKQFRDVADPTRACFQSITEAPIRMDHFGGGWFLSGKYEVVIAPAESHQIVQDFGLPGNVVPVELAWWMRMGFSAMPGKDVWKAPT